MTTVNFKLKMIASFIGVYLIWGTTYLGMKITVTELPPYLVAGLRFSIAGALIMAVCRAKGFRSLSRSEWKDAIVIGLLLILAAHGSVNYGLKYIDSWLAAVLVATLPFWLIVIEWLPPYRKRPSAFALACIASGWLGVWLLVWPQAGEWKFHPVGVGSVLVGSFCWALGSIQSRKLRPAENPWVAVGPQMFAGGLALVLVGLGRGEWSEIVMPSTRASIAFIYLIVIGSWVAWGCYFWLLRHVATEKVATYAFVNPWVAMLVGSLVLGETISKKSLMASAIIIVSVAVLLMQKKRNS
jgi:drug/metabolite transporter (DMT)-like permease